MKKILFTLSILASTYTNSGFLEVNQVGDKRQHYQTPKSNVTDTRTDVVKQKAEQAQHKQPQFIIAKDDNPLDSDQQNTHDHHKKNKGLTK